MGFVTHFDEVVALFIVDPKFQIPQRDRSCAERSPSRGKYGCETVRSLLSPPLSGMQRGVAQIAETAENAPHQRLQCMHRSSNRVLSLNQLLFKIFAAASANTSQPNTMSSSAVFSVKCCEVR